jgi:hypothetical protein
VHFIYSHLLHRFYKLIEEQWGVVKVRAVKCIEQEWEMFKGAIPRRWRMFVD